MMDRLNEREGCTGMEDARVDGMQTTPEQAVMTGAQAGGRSWPHWAWLGHRFWPGPPGRIHPSRRVGKSLLPQRVEKAGRMCRRASCRAATGACSMAS